MRVTSIQVERRDQSKAEVIEQVVGELDRPDDTDLFLLPEIWPVGFFRFDEYAAEAEELNGPTVARFRKLASDRGVWLLMGSLVERGADGLFNTSVLIDAGGEIQAVYRKIHLFGYKSREPELLTRGREPTVAETPWGKVGLATCYDLRFPELFRKMMSRGALAFLVVSAWPEARRDAWRLFNRARAHENLAYLISCNCAGRDNQAAYAGHSMVVEPWGKIIAEGGAGQERVSAAIDFNYVAEVRREFRALEDRVFPV
jgi:predicted amidohydrolase